MSRPLAIDLFCGLGGWTEGLLAEGYDVIGFDIERHEYGDERYPAQLVLQDVLTLHGRQFKTASLIVASPPCQAYSWRAMPWKAAKAAPPPDNSLFEACFRIQREACEAAGRHIPLVVENVRGAQKWVGRSRWNYGSFHLWGDVPALMPIAGKVAKVPGFRFDGSGKSFQSASVEHSRDDIKNAGGSWFRVAHNTTSGKGRNPDGRPLHTPHMTNPAEHGLKMPGIELGQIGFNVAAARKYGALIEGVKIERNAEDKRNHIGAKRKYASAMIAKIPLALSRHIAATFKPESIG